MDEIVIENAWLLDKDLKDSRVIDGNEVKLYRESAIIAYLDGEYEDSKFTSENPTRIVNDDGKMIGYANVRLQNRKIVADLAIDYSTPERLAAETRDGVRHYVRVQGHISMNAVDERDLVDFPRHIKKTVHIHALFLTINRSSDPRIQPFGDPILV
jgi:hypothetical protein